MQIISQRFCNGHRSANEAAGLKVFFALLVFAISWVGALAQTSGTGAVTGTLSDQSGAAIAGAQVKITSAGTGEVREVSSDPSGLFYVGLLLPGQYNIEVSSAGFKTSYFPNVTVIVGSTSRLDVQLQIGATTEKVTVEAAAEQIQTESSTLGHVTNEKQVQDLPLATRNYTQIIALNPNVQSDVWNSSALGNGGSVTGATSVMVSNGGTFNDNGYQMNGVGINDLGSNGTGSGGVALPNPDTIQEFRVLTGQFDASYGRNAGANVDVITKGGTNEFHGSAWEFFRNTVLDANTFFRNANDQPRPVLQQNQFGFTFGGPIRKNKLTFFASYEGNRQRNGLDPQCSDTISSAPLTNDRSAAALGALFAGQSGANGGTAILADGSNINPVALQLLQMKLPNGQYLIPTPQTINPSLPFDSQGTSALSVACPYTDDQFMTNADYQISDRSKLSGRFFFSNNGFTYTLPFTSSAGASVPGFPTTFPFGYRNFSLTHTYVFSSNLLNQASIAFHRVNQHSTVGVPFTFSDIGSMVPSYDNDRPQINIDFPSSTGVELGGSGQAVTIAQNTYTIQDSLEWLRGRHRLRFGGGVVREQYNNVGYKNIANVAYLSWADFLLGMSAAQNGSANSNVFLSSDNPGIFDRAYRVWEANAYAQDDFQMTKRFTLNLGLRYDRLGCISDALGRNSTLDLSAVDRNPPAEGTIAGTQVPSNYTGTIPPGVVRGPNGCAMNGDGQNTWNPRVGFAWQIPQTNRVVLRGGYGIYHSRYVGQTAVQLLGNSPFSIGRLSVGTSNAAATSQVPFNLNVPSLPSFIPYSPTTQNFLWIFDPKFRPPMSQQYSLGVQVQVAPNSVLEVGYSGSRGLHQVIIVDSNQAGIASPSDPIRGETTNTLANLYLRLPYQGFFPGPNEIESEGSSWYNALLASFTKRFSHGLQAQVSYTFAKQLSDSYQQSIGFNGGTVEGNSNDPKQSYGPDFYVRPHRFVANFTYDLPGPKDRASIQGQLLGGWAVSSVVVIQAGHYLTPLFFNGNSVYGNFNDRASLSGTCTPGQYVHSGNVEAHLNDYINASCFAQPAVFSSDDPNALGFGNAGVGLMKGPGQNNWDIGIFKQFAVRWPREFGSLEFRTEFFNAFNHAQFADPDTNYGDSTFGQISKTSVNPRLIQFALKYSF